MTHAPEPCAAGRVEVCASPPRVCRRLALDTRGGSSVEYTIVLALVVAAAVGAWRSFGGQVECSVQAATEHLREALGGPPAPMALEGCNAPTFAAGSATTHDPHRLGVRAEADSNQSAHGRNEDLRFSSGDPDNELEGEDHVPSRGERWRGAGKRAVDAVAGFVSGFVPYGSLVLSKAPFGNERTFAVGQVTGAAAGLIVDAAMISGGTGGAVATAPAVITGVGTVVPASGAAVAAAGMRAVPGHALNLAVAKAKLKGATDAPGTGAKPSVTNPKPSVTDPKLSNLVNDLYKGAKTKNPVGSGSTADAIRQETATGQPVGGKFHTQKGQEYARALENWLAKNPSASAADRSAAQSILDDLRNALGGK
jgi:Flp pilus assembly pilin Flp